MMKLKFKRLSADACFRENDIKLRGDKTKSRLSQVIWTMIVKQLNVKHQKKKQQKCRKSFYRIKNLKICIRWASRSMNIVFCYCFLKIKKKTIFVTVAISIYHYTIWWKVFDCKSSKYRTVIFFIPSLTLQTDFLKYTTKKKNFLNS